MKKLRTDLVSRIAVDQCLAEIEREEEREREALSAFYRRETLRKVPMHVTGMQLFWWCLFTLGVAVVLLYVIAEG
jgi:hypothetical protein